MLGKRANIPGRHENPGWSDLVCNRSHREGDHWLSQDHRLQHDQRKGSSREGSVATSNEAIVG